MKVIVKSECLIEAIENQSLEEAKYWISKNPQSVNEDRRGVSVLELAAAAGGEFVELLIQHGVKINQQGENKQTVLLLAVVRDEKEAVEILLKSGANASLRGKDDCDAVHMAIYCEKVDFLKLLLKSEHIDIKSKNKEGGYLEFSLLNSGYSERAAELAITLMDHGIPVDQMRSALEIAKNNENVTSLCRKVIEERVLALDEQEALQKVVGQAVSLSSDSENSASNQDIKSKRKSL